MDPFDNQHTEMPAKVNIVDDHEISMAAAQVYRAAKCAMEIHRLLKMVNNLEGWMQAKITLAADYLEAVSSNLEYDLVAATMMENQAAPQSMSEDEDDRHKKIAALGRRIMDLAQESRPKTDEDFDLVNKFSAVGEKMTMIGTPFGPKGLTSEEKDLVRRAQDMLKKKDHKQLDEALPGIVGKVAGAVQKKLGMDPTSREMRQVNPQGRLVNILMNWGMGRDAAGEMALQYIKANMLNQPRPTQIKKWTDMLVAKGRNSAEASRMANDLVGESVINESRHHRHLPGVSGEIISTHGDHVLVLDKVRHDEKTEKNEYEVYTKDGERVTNLDMPYATPHAAVKKFRKKYSS
jgi:hypothetical protein